MSKKQTKKEKNNKNLIAMIIAILLVSAILIGIYIYALQAPSKKAKDITFKISAGDTKLKVVDNLKDAGLIKSKCATFIYIYLSGKTNLQAGTYSLSPNNNAKDIIKNIHTGQIVNTKKVYRLTFVEGQRLEDYVKFISKKTGYTEENIYKEITDEEYLKELISNYWFIDESILNKDLYYGLEGYLFPSTYEFYEDASIKDIFNKLIGEMGKTLDPLKPAIEQKQISVHDLLSKASIIEKEALNKEDREKVSQVISSRLKLNMTLGMDVTTYYAVKKDMKESLTKVDLNTNNPYNTRCPQVKGLPVGPICSPSKMSIEAALNPANTEYLYFYADINTGKVYFAKTNTEFYNIIKEVGGY